MLFNPLAQLVDGLADRLIPQRAIGLAVKGECLPLLLHCALLLLECLYLLLLVSCLRCRLLPFALTGGPAVDQLLFLICQCGDTLIEFIQVLVE